MKVRHIKQSGGSLTIDRVYEVIGIEANSYRIINDDDSPCLYESSHFETVETSEPEFWVSEFGSDGERYAYPKEWNRLGFFEDFHDNVQGVVNQFWHECYQFYGISRGV